MYFLLFQYFDNYVIYYNYICQSRILSSVYILHMIVTVRWTGGLSYIFATLPEIKAVLNRGTQRLFSVKCLFGEENIRWNFLLLEDG